MSVLPLTFQDILLQDINTLKNSICTGNCANVLNASFKLCEPLKSNLSAKEYYEFFLTVFDGLSLLSDYISLNTLGKDFYDQGQFHSEIIPRLYITVTIGIALYTQTQDPEILEDVLEMVKGVKHPLRGLFLRFYLNKRIKELLKENSLSSIRLLLNNLSEMNSLWSRIEIIEEREAMKITVGENIERLSVLCTEKEFYLKEIFPKCVEIINQSDIVSKQYLLDCIIQAFPDEFLLDTCNDLLRIACTIQIDANIIDIILSSLTRLLVYLKEIDKTINEDSLFYMQEYLKQIFVNKPASGLLKTIELHLVVIKFSNKTEKGVKNILSTLETCSYLIDTNQTDEKTSSLLSDLLSFPLEICLLKVIVCPYFHTIHSDLQEKDKLKVGLLLIKSLFSYLNSNTLQIEDLEFWNNLFEYLEVLVNDSMTGKVYFIRILHKINFNYDIYNLALQRFCKEELILTSLAFLCLKSVRTSFKIPLLVLEIIRSIDNANLAILVTINCINGYNTYNLKIELLEYFEIIIKLYEKVENSNRVFILTGIIGCIVKLKDYIPQIDSISQLCYKISKKIEQCNILLSLAHVFWSNTLKDPTKLIETLKRSVKIADLCVSGTKNLGLFVSILNSYLYFYSKSVPGIEATSINSIIELIFELLVLQYEKDFDCNNMRKYLNNTIDYIQARQSEQKLNEINSYLKNLG
jgi:vacuolar protein sorting-associated protein 35